MPVAKRKGQVHGCPHDIEFPCVQRIHDRLHIFRGGGIGWQRGSRMAEWRRGGYREDLGTRVIVLIAFGDQKCGIQHDGHRVAVAGLEHSQRFPNAQPIHSLLYTIDIDPETARGSLTVVGDPDPYARWVARHEATCILQFDSHLGDRQIGQLGRRNCWWDTARDESPCGPAVCCSIQWGAAIKGVLQDPASSSGNKLQSRNIVAEINIWRDLTPAGASIMSNLQGAIPGKAIIHRNEIDGPCPLRWDTAGMSPGCAAIVGHVDEHGIACASGRPNREDAVVQSKECRCRGIDIGGFVSGWQSDRLL